MNEQKGFTGEHFNLTLVITTLCLVGAALACALIWLTLQRQQIPGALLQLATLILGGLLGLLGQTSSGRREPQPVQVTNPPAHPVPVKTE